MFCKKCHKEIEKISCDSEIDYHLLKHRVDICFDLFKELDEEMDEMSDKLKFFNKVMENVIYIEERGEQVLSLFAKKAHDLKSVDARRDDVINSLCQKIAELEK